MIRTSTRAKKSSTIRLLNELQDKGNRFLSTNDKEDLNLYNFNDFMSKIRLKAASVLTSSLPPSDRDKLLSSLGAMDESKAKEKARVSIGEAVAEAVLKESLKRDRILEKEREEIRLMAEKAAEERVKNDLLIQERQLALERWKEDLEDEKRHEKENKKINGAKGKLEEESLLNEQRHPILGAPITDLGYKRVHLTSAKALATIPIWEKQRVYRHDRAKAMANDKLKSIEVGLPGIIALHEDENGKLSILDGQHRVGMLAILQNEKLAEKLNIDLDKVLVEVFPHTASSSTTYAKDIFTEINKAEPVKLVDMPGVAKGSDRRMINNSATQLQESFPEMFKTSQRCRAPHLNIDNLRDAIFAADVLKRHSIKSSKSLMDWMMDQNAELRKRYKEGKNIPKAVSPTALAKANKYDFYLGLDSSWLYN